MAANHYIPVAYDPAGYDVLGYYPIIVVVAAVSISIGNVLTFYITGTNRSVPVMLDPLSVVLTTNGASTANLSNNGATIATIGAG